MATHRSQRDNADAFDDLLGQLVDELAMRPTMVPELEPMPPPPVAVAVAVAPVYQAPYREAPPPRSNVMGLAVGGGIAVAGIAIALVLMMGRSEPPQPDVPQVAVAAVAPPAVKAPVAPVLPPAPVVTPTMPAGTGVSGPPLDPAALALAGSPVAPTPAPVVAAPAKKSAPKKVVTPPKKTAPVKPKVVDPFG